MATFEDHLERVERKQQTLEVYSAEPIPALERQFGTKNVRVTHRPLPPDEDSKFIVIRDSAEEFVGSIGVDALETLLSPEAHLPWESPSRDGGDIFEFLDETLFSSFDRTQMLVTVREIEERAWRHARGTLYVGFQDKNALADQRHVYDKLANTGALTVHLYARDEWDVDGSMIHDARPNGEIGTFWFAVYDDETDGTVACALLAEEREPGSYYGFWTYDPADVADLVAHIRSAYGPP